MLKISIGSSIDPIETLIAPTVTVQEAFRQVHQTINAESVVMLNSNRLNASQLNKSLAEVGVCDGDVLSVSQKMKSA